MQRHCLVSNDTALPVYHWQKGKEVNDLFKVTQCASGRVIKKTGLMTSQSSMLFISLKILAGSYYYLQIITTMVATIYQVLTTCQTPCSVLHSLF